MRRLLERWKTRTIELRTDALTLYYAYRDPRTPRITRFVAIAVAAYALSPIDLMPDFLPAIGLVDDAAVMTLAFKLVHDDVKEFKAWREKNQPK